MGRKKLVSDEQLLEAARQVFVERGMRASTREVARRAGVSEAVLFQRYETKADLFLAAMVPPSFDFSGSVGESAGDRSGKRVIRDLFIALLDYFRAAAPVMVQLLANQDFEFEKFATAHPENTLVTLRLGLVALMDDLKRKGKLGADPRAVALALFMSAHSLAVFERMGAHGGRFSDEMVEMLLGALWEGFKPVSKTQRN